MTLPETTTDLTPNYPPAASLRGVYRRQAFLLTTAAAAGAFLLPGASVTSPDADLMEACAEFSVLGTADRAAWASVLTEEDGDAASAFTDHWSEKRAELLEFISDTRALTLTGIVARAKAIVAYEPEHAEPSDDASSHCENSVRAVIRDLLSLLGGVA